MCAWIASFCLKKHLLMVLFVLLKRVFQIKMNLIDIRYEVEKDLNIHKVCESCEAAPSEYLYIIKSLLFGIFHVCEDCKSGLECSDMPDTKSTFVKKFQTICWEDYVEAPADIPLR